MKPSVKHSDDVTAQAVTAGTGATRQVLIGPDEGPHFALRRFNLIDGGNAHLIELARKDFVGNRTGHPTPRERLLRSTRRENDDAKSCNICA